MTTTARFVATDPDDVLVCEYEQRPRGAPSFADLRAAITAVAKDGEALRVDFDPAQRAAVEQLVAAERRCCPTLAFELSLPPALTLHIRGTPGQLATLQQLLTMDPAAGGWS